MNPALMFATRTHPQTAPPAPSDARRELLRRVLDSTTFQKCERLSSLLLFVCELTLQGRELEINEQRIGEAVFGRARDYDSSVDGIVRTQASRLRSRLDLYFRTLGVNEPVEILIPRGGYVPRFESRAFKLAQSSPPPGLLVSELPGDRRNEIAAGAFPENRPSSPRRWIAQSRVLWALAALLVAGLVFSFQQQSSIHAAHRHLLWSSIFVEKQRTLIAYGDSGLVMWQNLSKRDVHLVEYLTHEYLKKTPESSSVNAAVLADIGERRYTSIVDLDIAQTLQQMAQAQNATTEHRYARDLRPNDLKQGNVILVGTAEANPWVELFEPGMNFYFRDDRQKRVFSVLNRAPTGNEPQQWDSGYNDVQHRVYAVVAYLPNLGGQGNALLIEGTSMAGTESAWDFVSDDSQLLPFLQRIRKPDGSIPHFEAVLGTNNMSGSAGKNVMLAWRTER